MFDQQVTFLYVRDLETSARFYGHQLGLKLILDQGSCRIYETSPGAFIGVCRCSETRPSNPEGIIVTLVTADVDSAYDRLRNNGVEFEKAPSANPDYNIYHCFLRDPDGHQLEIQRFNDPAWPEPN